jgi:hypothetical protein
MTRMRFSFRSAPDQLCTPIHGSNPRYPDLNTFKIRWLAIAATILPELLWLYSMGIVLYWVHDTSSGCAKTYRLIDSTAPLAERLIRLARVPGLRSLTRRLLRVADDVLY